MFRDAMNMTDKGNAWYCLKSKPKQEHIATGYLKYHLNIEVFCPRMRYKKATSRGPVWFTEAIFPSYVFAKFDASTDFRKVSQAIGIESIVHFGDEIPVIPENIIQDLRKHMDGKEMIVFSQPVDVGETVNIINGPMMGMEVVVTGFLPAKQRVKILVDVLGNTTTAEIDIDNLGVHPINPLAA